jgi:uncharacterized protein (TIGR03067 family)
MFLTKIKTAGVALFALAVLGTGLGVGTYRSSAGERAADETGPTTRQVAQRPNPPDSSPLHGVWRVVSVEIDGEKLAPEDNARWVIAERHINRYQGDRSIGRWTYELPAEDEKPATIYLIPPDSRDRMHGIYEIVGDTLRVCYTRTGPPWPGDFSTLPGSGRYLFTLKRTHRAEGRTLPPEKTAAAEERDDRDALQGTWVLAYSERNGAQEGPRAGSGGRFAKWVIGRDTIHWVADPAHQPGRDWHYRIDPQRRPRWFDLSAPDVNLVLRGIYALHGDQLVICLATQTTQQPQNGDPQAVRGTARPRDFTSNDPGGGTYLWILRKDDGTAPGRRAGRGRLALEREALKKEMEEDSAAVVALRKSIEELKQRRAEEDRRRAAEEAARQREEGEVARLLLENIRLRDQLQQLRRELRRLREEQKSLEDRGAQDASPRQ